MNVTGRSALLLAALAMVAAPVDAGAGTIRYEAIGQINDMPGRPGSTITGPEVARIVDGAGTIPEAGRFEFAGVIVTAPPAGEASRYDRTPVQFELRLPDLEATIPAGAPGGHADLRTVLDASVVLDGYLDATILADGTADLTLSIERARPGSLRMFTADHIRRFDFPLPLESLIATTPQRWSGTIAPGGTGRVGAFGQVGVVPEPATRTLFLAALAGLALRGRLTRPGLVAWADVS